MIRCPECKHPDHLDDIVNEIIHESNCEKQPEYQMNNFEVSFPVSDAESYVLPGHLAEQGYITDTSQPFLNPLGEEESSHNYYHIHDLPAFKSIKYAKRIAEDHHSDEESRRQSVICYMNIWYWYLHILLPSFIMYDLCMVITWGHLNK